MEQAGGAQNLGRLGTGGATAAYGISADGSVVIGFSDGPDGREAYRWTEAGGMQG
jgi:probable HAF family extracellular repeat protein